MRESEVRFWHAGCDQVFEQTPRVIRWLTEGKPTIIPAEKRGVGSSGN